MPPVSTCVACDTASVSSRQRFASACAIVSLLGVVAACSARSPDSSTGTAGNSSAGDLSAHGNEPTKSTTGTAPVQPIGAFYRNLREPDPAAAAGTIVASEQATSPFATGSTRRIAYVVAGSPPTVETGLVVTPDTAAPRGLLVVGHHTVGTADVCAPSADPTRLAPMRLYLDTFVAAGYALAIPDYAGLGSPGPHPYLVANTAAASLLAILEPARTSTGVTADKPVGFIGFSQGGQAVLAAAAQLDVAGVVAISPVADLLSTFERANAFPPAGLLATLVGHQQAEPALRLRDVLTPAGIGATQRLASTCNLASLDLGDWEDLLQTGALTSGPWAAALARDSASNFTPRSPTLLIRGDADPVFTAVDEQRLADTWCSPAAAVAGPEAEIDTITLAGADHGETNTIGGPHAAQWLLQRLGDGASNVANGDRASNVANGDRASNEAAKTTPLC